MWGAEGKEFLCCPWVWWCTNCQDVCSPTCWSLTWSKDCKQSKRIWSVIYGLADASCHRLAGDKPSLAPQNPCKSLLTLLVAIYSSWPSLRWMSLRSRIMAERLLQSQGLRFFLQGWGGLMTFMRHSWGFMRVFSGVVLCKSVHRLADAKYADASDNRLRSWTLGLWRWALIIEINDLCLNHFLLEYVLAYHINISAVIEVIAVAFVFWGLFGCT